MRRQTSDKPLPVTVIGGYLGAGKTTLINHMLHNANGMRLAILVNDFGDKAIDAALIESQEGDVISLSGGCVCCSYRNDLQAALMDTTVLSEPPDHIVIESSGVALPGAIGSALSLIRSMRLHGIVTLVDVSTLQQLATDKYLADTIERQLQDADIVVLNKSDLVEPGTLNEARIRVSATNSTARTVATSYCEIANMVVLDEQPQHQNTTPAINIYSSNHTQRFKSVKLNISKPQNALRLAEILASKQSALLRAKGFVQDLSGDLKTIQVVGRRWTVTDAPTGVDCGVVCIGLNEQWNLSATLDGIDGINQV